MELACWFDRTLGGMWENIWRLGYIVSLYNLSWSHILTSNLRALKNDSERKALARRIVNARVKLSEWHRVAMLRDTIDWGCMPPSCSVTQEQALPSRVPSAFSPSESQVGTCSWLLECSEPWLPACSHKYNQGECVTGRERTDRHAEISLQSCPSFSHVCWAVAGNPVSYQAGHQCCDLRTWAKIWVMLSSLQCGEI